MTVKVRVKKGLTYRNIKLAKDTVLEIPKTTAERRQDLFEPLVSGIIIPPSVLDEVTALDEKKPKRRRSRSRSQE